MKIKTKNLKKILVLMGLFLYLLVTVNLNTLIADALLTLVFAGALTIKNRKNNLFYIFSFFIFYCVYSIVVGEYLTSGALGVALTQAKTFTVYSETIKILLIFISILFLFFPVVKSSSIQMKYKDNSFIFYVIYSILVTIGLFGVDRNIGAAYEVSISPVYEYSTILFLFAYYTSGNKKYKKIFLNLLLIGFILQDFYYGGRITSLQLVIVFISCVLNERISAKSITIGSIVGLIVANFIASYRVSYSFSGITIGHIINNLFNNKFVFGTATHSYYASATHVASIMHMGVGLETRLNSFVEFLKSIVIGGGELIGNVTAFVSQNYIINVGGGIFPTHFYFWLGWGGVILSAFLIVKYISVCLNKDSDISELSLILLISSSPRWFLYNPLLLFRVQFILILLFCLYNIGHNSLLSVVKKKKNPYLNHNG